MHGHSGTSVYFTSKHGLAEPIQRRHYETTLHDINQDPTAAPSFLGLNEGQKALLCKHEKVKKICLVDGS